MPAVQVSTVFDPVYAHWENRVGRTRVGSGGLEDKDSAVAAGRAVAIALHAVHVVHNEDGTVASRESHVETRA